MNERELGKSLLKLDATDLSGVPDVHRQTRNVLERDRRRVRLLSGLTILAWLLSAALILTVLVAFGLLMPKQAKLRREVEEGKFTQAEREATREAHLIDFEMGTLLIAFSVAVLSMAALCTVLLNFASRRATLRQINANLLVISEQLRQLRHAGHP